MASSFSQNSQTGIDWLAAASHYYNTAKFWHQVRLSLTVVLALLGPATLWLWPDARGGVALLGAAFAVLGQFVFGPLEQDSQKLGAKVQEQFDTTLFELPWNALACGDRPAPELVSAGARAFRGDREGLRNWYPDMDDFDRQTALLVAQHTNCVWDFRLRRHYGRTLAAISVVWFLLLTLIAALTEATVTDLVLSYIVPSLPALLLLTGLARQHLQIASEKERLADRVRTLAAAHNTLEDAETGRRVQDRLYRFRVDAPVVPNLWQRWFRPRFEADARAKVDDFRRTLADSRHRIAR